MPSSLTYFFADEWDKHLKVRATLLRPLVYIKEDMENISVIPGPLRLLDYILSTAALLQS
jgi:hypothetical protein